MGHGTLYRYFEHDEEQLTLRDSMDSDVVDWQSRGSTWSNPPLGTSESTGLLALVTSPEQQMLSMPLISYATMPPSLDADPGDSIAARRRTSCLVVVMITGRPAACSLSGDELRLFDAIIIIIIILFESGNMAHTQTHKDIKTDRQTDRISKKSTIKHSKGHKNADGLTHRSSFTRSLLCLLRIYRKDFL